MNMPLGQLIAAIVMIAVALGIVFAMWRYMAARSEQRMMAMMECVGLDPAIASSGDTRTIIKEIRQRCRHCGAEGYCERWLAGKESGDNEFCPNAKVWESLKETTGIAAG